MINVTNLPNPSENLCLSPGSAQVSERWWSWFLALKNLFKSGFTGTVALAKLTPGGTNGSLTLVNGVATAYVAPT